MRRDRDASKLWTDIYDLLSAGKPGVVGALLSRAEAHVVRLSCIYAILDKSATVRVEHLSAALALWDYAEASTRLIFADRTGDNGQAKLLAALRENPAGLSRQEITVNVFRRNRTRREISALLSDMLFDGLIHRITPDESTGPGRKPEIWRAGREGRTCVE
jgi:hypothetical protein